MRLWHKRIVTIASLLLLLPMVPANLTGGVVQATGATFPISQSFTGNTATNWVLGGSAKLTGDGSTDPVGSGWLRLTGTALWQAGYAYYNQPFPSSLGITVDFDFASWGGNGADGTSFYLIDGSTTSFTPGTAGGGLGYSQNTTAPGVSNGYVGIGLDEYGNFATPYGGHDGPGITPMTVGIRGPGNLYNGYSWITGAGSTLFSPKDRSAGVHVRMYITKDKKITVQIRGGTGLPYTTVINQAQLTATPPATFMLGFGASTGGSTNNHEVRNLTVSVPTSADVGLTASSNSQPLVSNQTVSPGQSITYTTTITNSGQNDLTVAAAGGPVTTALSPSGLQNISWTCTGSGGGTCAASGTSLTPTEELPVGAAVTYTISAQVANPATGPVQLTSSVTTPSGYTNTSASPSASLNLNLAPTAQNQSVSFSQNTPKTFTLQASDADGDTLTATLVSGPAHGNVNFAGLSATYTPTSGYIGTDSFSYTVKDSAGATSNTATVSLSVPSPNLSNLVPSSGTLSPAFSSGTTAYSVSVPYTTTSLTLTPTAVDAQATIKVNGSTVTNGSASAPIALSVGNNTINTVVTASDGITSQTYSVSVTRTAASTNANLSGLTTSQGTLSPAFSSSTTGYTASVASTVTSLTVTPTAADTTVTVTVNGTAVQSGSASSPIALAVGSNTITVVTTAQDGVTTKTYTITVTRAAPAAAISAPTASAYLATATPAISGTADVGTTVTVTLDGSTAGTATVNSSGAWSFTPATGLSDGSHTVQATAVASDGAGGAASSPVQFWVDTVPPTTTATADRAANANGWYNAPVKVTFNCSDATGVTTCPSPVTLASDGANQSVSGTATDKAGLSTTVTLSGINIDKTPPTITVAPDRAANANGWYNAAVTYTFTCTDALSGVATCPAPITLSGEGANQSVTGTATDKAGNSNSVTLSGINIDKTPPTVTATPDRAPNGGGWYNGPVKITFTCSAPVAGVATCPAPVTLSGDGANQSVTGTATDKAGNSASVTLSGINIQVTPPQGSVQIGDGAGITDQPLGSLTLSATSPAGIASMRFSTDGSAWSAWEPYGTREFYSLAGDGDHTVSVQFQDKAGNLSTGSSAHVVLSKVKPQGKASIIGVGGDQNNPLLQLAVSLQADPRIGGKPSQVRFAVDGGAWSDWQDVTPQMQVPLTPGDGLRTVAIQFGRDKGAVSEVQRLQLLLAYRGSGEGCYAFEFPAAGGPVGTYYADPGLQRLVRLATIYDQATGRGTAVARHPSPGFWLTIPEPAVSFSDIGDSQYKDEIVDLAQMNIAHGYKDGTFLPHNNITRAEAATLIVLAAQVGDAGQKGFPDAAGHWAERIIGRAAQANVVNGYPDGLFRPDSAVTRAEFVKMLTAPFALPQRPAGSANLFTDLSDHWSQEVVESAAAAHIVPTDSASFRPDDPITREEAVHMLFNAVNYLFSQLGGGCQAR